MVHLVSLMSLMNTVSLMSLMNTVSRVPGARGKRDA